MEGLEDFLDVITGKHIHECVCTMNRYRTTSDAPDEGRFRDESCA